MNINILGTEYKIESVPSLEDRGGETDFYAKVIRISEMENASNLTTNLKGLQAQILRHELTHAFLFESGLAMSSNAHECWALNEEMVDWIAIQLPKINKAYEEVVKEWQSMNTG